MQERKREENRQRAMEEIKCFVYRGFGHIAHYCRNIGEEGSVQMPLNKLELRSKVMQRGERSRSEVGKDRKKILREEKAKREVEIQQTKVERKEKKEKVLREVTMKIGLKQEEEEERIVTETLLDSGATGLVMSKEFARRYRFRRTKLEKLIYMRNVDGMFNYMGPIINTVEVEIFFKGYKERTLIDVIGDQKWEVILGMSWLTCHNLEIDQRTEEVQIMRYPEKCGKKQRKRRQTKLEWQKQKEKEKKRKEFSNRKREKRKKRQRERFDRIENSGRNGSKTVP